VNHDHTQHLRSLAAHLVIGAGLCLGVHALLVAPAERELAELRRRTAEARVRVESVDSGRDRDLAIAALERVRGEVETAVEAGRPAGDEAGLLRAVMDLARESGVTVEQVSPLAPRSVSRAGAAPVAPVPAAPGAGSHAAAVGAGPDSGDGDEPIAVELRRAALALNARGTFEDLVLFVEGLESRLGLTTVRALRFVPDGVPGSRQLTAQIETEHVGLAPSTLAALRARLGPSGAAVQAAHP
jgi:hypothetical protein